MLRRGFTSSELDIFFEATAEIDRRIMIAKLGGHSGVEQLLTPDQVIEYVNRGFSVRLYARSLPSFYVIEW